MKLRHRIASLFILMIVPFVSIADTYPVNPGIDIVHYRFEIDLGDKSGRIVATAGVQAKFLTSGIRQLRLDLVNQTRERAGRGMTVSVVTAEGNPLKFRHERDVLLIDLPELSTANDVLEVFIGYSGIPVTGLLIKENKYGELTAFSDNWPDKARNWLPTVDHISDKATSEMLITAPEQWQVVSNGLLVEQSGLGNGMRRTHWRQSVPIAPWLYVLAAADFAVQYVDEFDHKSIQTWVYRQDRDAGFYDFAVPTRQVLEFMSSYVGPFVYEKLANIQGNSVGGGMEAASAILYSDAAVTGERTARWRYVIVHEIAHQWFGNSVTEASWDDVWLSEGFATYFSYLFFEYADGYDLFIESMADVRDKVFEFHDEQPDYRIVHDNLDDMTKVTTRQIYNKGAWTLHMLRNLMGDENWWNGIQNYYRKYMNSHASTADFRFEMESACRCDLTEFFDQWLYQGGNIVLDGTWQYNEQSGSVDISLAQAQGGDSKYSTVVEIGVYASGEAIPSVHQLMLEAGGGRLSIPVAEKPDTVVIDPRTVLLARWTFNEVLP
ncbi:MAG: M1 family metallopeptidase [Proteobacteria bacterium]|nr:M1 family metallopeptidase [Pseudomonadota bacterium]MDA0992051.1 M1 family metallopeptidase [Pseudomonadota bacterium]